jgi:DNA helicase HerA-like ATPase
MLQELIPIAKARYSTGRSKENHVTRSRMVDVGKFTVDTPVPYRISDLTSLIDERMGKLENKRDIGPYRNLKTRFEILSLDPRYAFMFGSLTVYDGMAQILGRIFRVPVNNKPITILELTGLPTEIINVVVSVVCRMTFDFALWSEGKVPVTLVCEEAHRYVPVNPSMGFEPCKRAIAKIAKEGRKYGASLCIVTQRPAEIDPTILSQCNTVFALRMSNDRDQAIVQSSISDTGSGLMEFLPALGQREAIAFGEGVTLPVRIRFDELPKNALPRSSTARFTEQWQHSVGDEGFLDQIVERWRHSSSGASIDQAQNTAMFADAIGIPHGHHPQPQVQPQLHAHDESAPPIAERERHVAGETRTPAPLPRREPLAHRREVRETRPPAAAATPAAQPVAQPPAATAPATPAAGPGSGSFRSLRDRLNQRR